MWSDDLLQIAACIYDDSLTVHEARSFIVRVGAKTHKQIKIELNQSNIIQIHKNTHIISKQKTTSGVSAIIVISNYV